jgi:GNAT superfamily N-acetyltransferase
VWHCGHALKTGAAILCCERRFVVRLCDCFCLGTAMATNEGRAKRSAMAPGRMVDLSTMPTDPLIRPIRDEDVEACAALAWAAISAFIPVEFRSTIDQETARGRAQARMRHFLEHDPGGCWTAEVDGRPVATALALKRDEVWGLSLFGVDPAFQAQGIGRAVLDAALGYADDCRGAIIASTLDPKALRRYARAGFALSPSFAGAGIVDRHAAPDPASLRARETTWDDPALVHAATEVSRAVRGASHAQDLPGFAIYDAVPLVLDGEGWAIRDGDGSPTIVAARTDEAARDLLWSCLLGGTNGATVHVDFLTEGQQWAFEVVLQARLALSTDGAVCVRGEAGPMRPYLLSGVFL